MSELSPAAKAVLNAVDALYEEDIPHDYCIMAAALRAAVAQTQRHPGHDIWQCDADDLLAIADELEAQ